MQNQTPPHLPRLHPSFQFRSIKPSDFNFILNSWLRSYRNSKFTKHLSNEKYYQSQSELIIHLLGNSTVLVAASIDDPDRIYGYALGNMAPDATGYWLQYAYVKHLYRRLGIATQLVSQLAPRMPIFVTHWRPVCAKMGWKRVQL